MLGEALASILRSRLGQYLDTQVISAVIIGPLMLISKKKRFFLLP
jgi:hypothetical protein